MNFKLKLLKGFSISAAVLHFIFIASIFSYVHADPHVHYTVSPERGTTETEFLVQVSITDENTQANNLDKLSEAVFEESKEMRLVHVSNSLQQQIINGNVSVQKSYIFKTQFKTAVATGEYTLPRGYVFVNNIKYRLPTKSIFIESTNQNSTLTKQPVPSDDGFQFLQRVSNEAPFVGEQISYTVEIIAPQNLEKAELEEFEPQGIWRERYGKDEKKTRRVQNITIHSFSESWFPVHAGDIRIPERILAAEVREFQKRKQMHLPLGQNLGEQLFGSLMPYFNQYRSVEKKIKTSGFQLQVKPLPPAPSEIKGYIPVGQIKANSSIDSERVQVGEPVTISIQVSGDANLRPLEIYSPKDLDTKVLKRYDSKPILNKTVGSENVVFYKTFKISLTPLLSGIIEVPSFSVHWFNPKLKEYQSYTTKRYLLKVEGDPTSSSVTQEESKELSITDSDKNIENEVPLDEKQKNVISKKLFIFDRMTSIYVSVVSLALLFLFFIYPYISQRYVERKNARSEQRHIIKNALAAEVFNESLDTISILIKQLLSTYDKNINSSLTTKEIKNILHIQKHIPVIEICICILERMDIYAYAGDVSIKQEIIDQTRKVLGYL